MGTAGTFSMLTMHFFQLMVDTLNVIPTELSVKYIVLIEQFCEYYTSGVVVMNWKNIDHVVLLHGIQIVRIFLFFLIHSMVSLFVSCTFTTHTRRV